LALALVVGASAQEASKGKATAATTPEEAVKSVEQAFKAGDPYAFLEQLAEPSRSGFQYELNSRLTWEAVVKALDEKFGKGNEAPMDSLKQTLRGRKNVWVYSKENKGEGKVELK